MPSDPFDDEAIEAFLSGGRRPADAPEALAAFARDVEVAVSGPVPPPRGNLATLLSDGFSPGTGEQRSSVAVPGPWAPRPRPALLRPQAAGPRRPKFAARLAGLGLAAKVGLGIGVAAASATGAGAAGVLPDQAQHAVATVVDTVTPFEFPDSMGGGPGVGVPHDGGVTPAPSADVPGQPEGDRSQGSGRGGGTNGADGSGSPGAQGLDRANQTPAAGHAPTSVPVPTTSGSRGSNGRDRANETPAAGHVPTSSPAAGGSGGSDGSDGKGQPEPTGLDRAGQTPAADHHPSAGPGRS